MRTFDSLRCEFRLSIPYIARVVVVSSLDGDAGASGPHLGARHQAGGRADEHLPGRPVGRTGHPAAPRRRPGGRPGPLSARPGRPPSVGRGPRRAGPAAAPAASPARTTPSDCPRLHRSRTGRFALPFGVRATDDAVRVALRIVDLGRAIRAAAAVRARARPRRRPRRRRRLDSKPPRTLRPVLFPGPAYGAAPGTTMLLGQAVRPGQGRAPVPWARIEAGLAGSGVVLWRAHAGPGRRVRAGHRSAAAPAALAQTGRAATSTSRCTRRRRPTPADPVDSPTGSRADPLYHLPVEHVAALDAGDPAEAGTAIPPGHTRDRRRHRATRPAADRCGRRRSSSPEPAPRHKRGHHARVPGSRRLRRGGQLPREVHRRRGHLDDRLAGRTHYGPVQYPHGSAHDGAPAGDQLRRVRAGLRRHRPVRGRVAGLPRARRAGLLPQRRPAALRVAGARTDANGRLGRRVVG